ncbi:MAG: hypothetical protein LBU87_00670 [Lactobacillales bacterium]|nr:hypothetical protein [Lactobacillales bacterium]
MISVEFFATDKSVLRIEIHDYEFPNDLDGACDFLLMNVSLRNKNGAQNPKHHERNAFALAADIHIFLNDLKNFQNHNTDTIEFCPFEPDFEMHLARIKNDNKQIKIFGHFDKPRESEEKTYGDVMYPFAFKMRSDFLPKIMEKIEEAAKRFPQRDG